MQLFAVSRTEQGIRRRQAEARSVALSLVPKPDPVPAPEPTPTREEIEQMVLELVREEVRQVMAAGNRALMELHQKWMDENTNKAPPFLVADSNRMTLAEVIRRLCKVFGVSKAELHGTRSGGKVLLCRQAIYYWAARRTGKSSTQIGKALQRDHSTVLHGMETYPRKRAQHGRTLRALR